MARVLANPATLYTVDLWQGHDFPTVFLLSVFGSFIAYIYSAPPLKLKMNGWQGSFALGASYISLPWWCGQAVFGELDKVRMTRLLSRYATLFSF